MFKKEKKASDKGEGRPRWSNLIMSSHCEHRSCGGAAFKWCAMRQRSPGMALLLR